MKSTGASRSHRSPEQEHVFASKGGKANDDKRGKIKILIVDDHQVVRQGLRTFLELNKDILVLGEAADGQEAVEMTDRLRPDIVLMDLVMPRLDGIAATSQIKSLGGATNRHGK